MIEVGQVYNVTVLNGNKVEYKMLAMKFESCNALLAKKKKKKETPTQHTQIKKFTD